MRRKIFDILNELGIDYTNYEHEPVFTCNEAKGVEVPGKRLKSLLIRNKKKTNFYMVVLLDTSRLDTNIIRECYSDTKMSFTSENDMMEKIGLKPGSVSPFALINNTTKDIKLIFDSALKNELVGFHPLQNDNTVVLHMDDMIKYVEKLGFEHEFLDL